MVKAKVMTEITYPAARAVAEMVEVHFARHNKAARQQTDLHDLAPQPNSHTIKTIIDASFWASLRREEGYSPTISLAYLPPEQAGQPLMFNNFLPLTPASLAKLSPAVERPGIHLGVWHDGDQLAVWGTTRAVPKLCFVLEVIEPGLLVVKYRRDQEHGKFVNVVVLNGDQIKEVDEHGTSLPDCPSLLTSLIGFGSPTHHDESAKVLVQLAASMRAHKRGGSLLVVPQGSDDWRDSIVWPVPYFVLPKFSELADLMREDVGERKKQLWQEEFQDAIDAIAGLTAVDGATIISSEYELLAFGAKIMRRRGHAQVEQVVVTEPIIGNMATIAAPVHLGGTRHLSAAQFAQDQPGSIALVASQDGRITVFAWSPCEKMVHAHRVETLLL